MKAFPMTCGTNVLGISSEQEGMDLRDWFAGNAPQFFAQMYLDLNTLAEMNYAYADAMMEARKND